MDAIVGEKPLDKIDLTENSPQSYRVSFERAP